MQAEQVRQSCARDRDDFSYLRHVMEFCSYILKLPFQIDTLLADGLSFWFRETLSYPDDDLQYEVQHGCQRGISEDMLCLKISKFTCVERRRMKERGGDQIKLRPALAHQHRKRKSC